MMRASLGIDSYAHVYTRGVKRAAIFRRKEDVSRLLANLFYFNHAGQMRDNWKRETGISKGITSCEWPDSWEEKSPIVSVLAYSIMPNHVHLILKEIVEGGTSKFMHRVSMAYSKFINEKYDENGSLFQRPFRSRLVEEDTDFRNLAVYVMVKNPFELYAGGLRGAIEHFDDAYERAAHDPFNSLGAYAGVRTSPIIAKDLLGELFETPESFKEFARETMLCRFDQLMSEEFD